MNGSTFKAIALAGAMAFATAALADGPRSRRDKPEPVETTSAFSWTGFYAGANLGVVWGDNDIRNTFQTQPGGGWAGGGDASTPALLSAAGTGTFSDTGLTGGGQIGYNWQTGALVLGVEADINWLDYKARRTVSSPYVAGGATGVDITDEVSADVLGTVRGRVGYAVGPVLFYLTGGIAFTKMKHTHSVGEFGLGGVPCAAGAGNRCDLGGSSSSTKAGWTIGGGGEFAFWRNWTIKTEYLYADFGDVTSTTSMFSGGPPLTPLANSGIGHSADFAMHIARLGLNYKF